MQTNNSNPARAILLAYLRAHWWVYLFSIALIIGASATQVQIPRILGGFTDALKQGTLGLHDPARFAMSLVVLAGAYVGMNWLAIFLLYSQARRFEYHLRNHLFQHWEKLSAAYYTHHSVGDLMAHATNDVQNLRASMGGGIFNLVSSVFTVTLAISMMIGNVDTRLALFSLIPLPFLTVAVVRLRPQIKRRSRAVQAGFSNLAERTQESISGIRVVKAYAQEEQELKRFSEVANDIVIRNLQLTQVSALFSPLIQLVGAITFLISLSLGGIRVIRGDLSLGGLVAFQYYLNMLVNPMQQIAMVIDVSQRASASLARITDLLKVPPDVKDSAHPVAVNRLHGEIVLNNLDFIYPGAAVPALEKLSLTIHAGQTIGVLGHTGAGKSTIANLLLRVYDPPRGSVFIDGNDILDIPLHKLRQNIGYVPQDIFLFSSSISENIAFAVQDVTAGQIETAAKQAQLYDNIMDFPDTFATEIGERGVTLSGGQRQRLALARALIKHAPILILDDSLSAVDTETEAAILESLRELRGGQTTLIIAHRISAVKEADLIVVLQDGQLVQAGVHDELVAVPGPYQDIYELQKKGTGVGTDTTIEQAHSAREGLRA